MNRSLVILRYAFDYFHAQIITIVCFKAMCLYYLYCLFARYYVDADMCMQSIIQNNLNNGLFNLKNHTSSSSLAHVGCINLCIEQKKYKQAIQLIENFKQNIKNHNNELYNLLTIRQAMLYMFIIKDYNELEQILNNQYKNLNKEVRMNLKNIYLIYFTT